jgi:pimeloyl-ACP methyl ester carboxylesterase
VAIAIASRRAPGHDGTELGYYVSGDPGGLPLVLCQGLGGGINAWKPLLDRLGEGFRVLTWDYRGLYRSRPARDPGAYDLSHHVRDLLALLDAEGMEAPVLAGWSMGVQLGLELHRTHPDTLSGFVAIHGTAGKPLGSAFDSGRAADVAPWVLSALRLVGERIRPVAPYLARVPPVVGGFVWASQQLGWMAPSVDVGAFRDMGEEWLGLDLRVYAEIFRHVGEHDAWDLLESIETPTLIIAGGADRFTPLRLSERMAKEMPNASLELLPEATHFGLLEFPEAIGDAVARFVRETIAQRADRAPALDAGAHRPGSRGSAAKG